MSQTGHVLKGLLAALAATIGMAMALGDQTEPNPSLLYLPLVVRSPTAPYPGAPLCPDALPGAHDYTKFHTLWDSQRGCHYDHEHGQNPFTPEVAAAFREFDLRALLGGVEIGHTNPSGPMENTHKHGGFKWNVQLAHPQGCQGYEGAVGGVNGSVIQYHAFGDYSVELESRVHSTAALLRQCLAGSPADFGYLYVVQLQDYGQRVVPYQGTIFPYPDTPIPAYNSGAGPYLTVNCIGPEAAQCRESRQQVVSRRLRASSNWTSKGGRTAPSGSTLFTLLFRLEDSYQNVLWSDQTHPFTFIWLCSSDNGLTYDAAGCHYNNSTTQVHEIAGQIPAAWDNLAGFDTDARPGRITAAGYVTRFGQLNLACAAPGAECFPIKMVNAFVGHYGSVLVFTEGKGANIVPLNPERDVYFCPTGAAGSGQVCADGAPGAAPSGWIGPNN